MHDRLSDLLQQIKRVLDEGDRDTVLSDATNRSAVELLSAANEHPANEVEILDEVIELYQRARDLTATHDPDLPSRLANLGGVVRLRFERTDNTDDLNRWIDLSKQVVGAIAVVDPNWAGHLSILGGALRIRFGRTGDIADLNDAIAVYEQALSAAPPDPARASVLFGLANALRIRSGRTNSPIDLDHSIEQLEQLITEIGDDQPDRIEALTKLGVALKTRFDRTRRGADLDRAIDSLQRAAAAAAPRHPWTTYIANNLGTSLLTRFERTDNKDDIERAVTFLDRAAFATPVHPDDLANLANALRARFARFDTDGDIDRAVDLLQRALATNPGHPGYLADLANTLRIRFMRTQSKTDLDRAVDLFERAIAATPDGSPNKLAAPKSDLGSALRARFVRFGDRTDLDRAIQLSEQAVTASAVDDPTRPKYLANLRDSLFARFARTGNLADLDRVVDLAEQALVALPADDPSRPDYVDNLVAALSSRFEITDNKPDLSRAVDLAERVLREAGDDDLARPSYMSSLGTAHWIRFNSIGDTADLHRAIELFEEAVASTDLDDPARPTFLHNLATALTDRATRVGNSRDLDAAVALREQALGAITLDDPDLARYQDSLASALSARFASASTNEIDDLNRAIELYGKAITGTPTDNPGRPGRLNNFANALRRRSSGAEDLAQAVNLLDEAVALTPPDHADRPMYLHNLGHALRGRFARTQNTTDLDRALKAYRAASTGTAGRAEVRASAARNWGRAAVTSRRWREAVKGYSAAIDLAGLMVPRDLARADQEFRLAGLSGLASEAAAACLQAGRPRRAVELFEQGRALMFSRILDARLDLTDLRRAGHDELANQFVHWRDVLNQSVAQPVAPSATKFEPGSKAENQADSRQEAGAEFERVLTEIRALPRFERFLTPRPVDELVAAAAEGPVVLINCSELRSDALILHPHAGKGLLRRFAPTSLRNRWPGLFGAAVQVVRLPGASVAAVTEQVGIFLDAVTGVQQSLTTVSDRHADRFAGPAATPTAVAVEPASVRLGQVLGWLGEHITGPVLDHLGYIGTPGEETPWPRVWWCPSGPLTLLPLHAAGTPADEFSNAVIDRVISSTTPTVRALLYARETPAAVSQPTALVVAMPHTKRQSDLPGAAQEAGMLQRLLAGRVDVLGLDGAPPATYHTVTAALPNHPWVHFACHGASNLANPSASYLLLDDYEQHPLTVLELTRLRLEQVEMAFLSACTTARGGRALPDEPIHMAAACQLAGYRHVIASLWPINDSDTATLTADYYRTLLDANRCSSPAVALHHATRCLRARRSDKPSNWAPYTHTGP
jgi:tetratricopeptide (TPR) repeat protein